MASVVLDASAVLALLNQEPGADVVEKYLAESILSTVNLAEILTVLDDIGVPVTEAKITVLSLVKEIIAFDEEQAAVAAALRKQTKSSGLSLGDRACLALAQTQDLCVLTADKAWKKVSKQVEVLLIR
jgi:ribonuclease VapC